MGHGQECKKTKVVVETTKNRKECPLSKVQVEIEVKNNVFWSKNRSTSSQDSGIKAVWGVSLTLLCTLLIRVYCKGKPANETNKTEESFVEQQERLEHYCEG